MARVVEIVQYGSATRGGRRLKVEVGRSGQQGATGPAGQGVPVGGTTGQVLAKKSATNYDTEWVAQTGGGGSGDVVGPASSVDGRVALFDGTTGKLLKQSTAAPVLEGDARLTDARTPTAHKTSHATGGSDALAPSDIGAVPTTRTINGLDLSANRTLTAADIGAAATSHVHSGADITSGTVANARLDTETRAAARITARSLFI